MEAGGSDSGRCPRSLDRLGWIVRTRRVAYLPSSFALKQLCRKLSVRARERGVCSAGSLYRIRCYESEHVLVVGFDLRRFSLVANSLAYAKTRLVDSA